MEKYWTITTSLIAGVYRLFANLPRMMKAKAVTLLTLLWVCTAAFGQVNKVEISGETLDENTIAGLRQLNPYFNITGDSATVTGIVSKYYALNTYLADLARKEKLDKDSAIAAKLATYKLLLENKLLAEEYENQQARNISLTTAEIKSYYESVKKTQFVNAGNCSFFQVQTKDTSKATIAQIKKIITLKLNLAEQERQSMKVYNDTLLINYTTITTANTDYFVYQQVFAAEINKLSGPFRLPNNNDWIYVFVTQKTEITFIPFEKVEDLCRSQLLSVKQKELKERWLIGALKEYPVKVTPTNQDEKDAVKIFYR